MKKPPFLPARSVRAQVLLNLALALVVIAPSTHAADSVVLQPRAATPKPIPTIKANTFYTARISETPDINQHMTYAQWLKQLPKSLHAKYTPPAEIGINTRMFFENFCGPASVADNLIYLRQHFPKIHDEPNPIAAGALLTRNLGFDYFGTVTEPGPEDFDPATGTGTSYKGMVKGTLDFLEKKGIAAKKVTVIGFVAHGDDRADYGHKGVPIQFEQRAPTISEIKQALHLRAIVVQHYGHYDYKAPPPARAGSGAKAKPYLRRTGGHYIAPVGYGLDKNKKPSPDTLIYHDPAGGYQDQQRQIYVNWMRQPKGAYQNLILLNPLDEDEKVRHKSLADPNWPQFEAYGSLSGTYTMDKIVASPKDKQRYEVMEGLIVIEL